MSLVIHMKFFMERKSVAPHVCFFLMEKSFFNAEKPSELRLSVTCSKTFTRVYYSVANPMFSGGLAQNLDFVCALHHVWLYVLFIRIPKTGANQPLWSILAVSSGSQCCECLLYSEIVSSARGCKCKRAFGNTTQSSSQKFCSNFTKMDFHAAFREEK